MMTSMQITLNRQRQNYYMEAFVFACIIALSFLLPYIILDKGLFLFYGDYVVQQVPFAVMMHDSVRSGNIFWSWLTDLGSSFLGTYSFYNIGSPFFFLTLPFPSHWVPYLMGPLICLKFGTASLTSYAYIERFVKTKELAVLGALMYAFSSFAVYDIFFNNFLDSVAFFPLVLIALEELIQHDRKGWFALTICLNALTNYFFFIMECVFLFLYWIIRSLSGEWDIDFRKFLQVGFEAVLGVAISAVLLLPAMLQVMGNTRVNNMLTGWNLLVYGWAQRLPDIIHSAFFPQDVPAFPNFFPDSGANWSSVAAWLPMFSMVGVISFMAARKGHWIKRILAVSFVCALIPGLNSLFILLVDSYYGRWFFMPLLFMSVATVIALDDSEIDLMHGLKWTGFITAAFALAIGLLPKYNDKKQIVQIGLEQYPDRFWIYVGIVAAGLVAVYVLLRLFRSDKKRLANASIIAVTVVICIYGNVFVATGKSYGNDTKWYTNVALNGAKQLKLDKSADGSYNYRVDVLNGIDNQAMFWGTPPLNAFNSIISSSTMKFYPSIGVPRDVGSRPDTSVPGIRPLLSVKYLFDSNKAASINMPGWSYTGMQLGFKVWKNDNYIPLGFTYDNYMTQKQFNNASSKDRILLKAMLLTENQIKTYAGILRPLTSDDLYQLSDEDMSLDCAARNRYTCINFSRDNRGFGGTITLDKQNLVFFSVPYDKGWTATVNGRPVKVEEVNVGFMAVLCPKGTSTIRFDYMTPGLFKGIAITAVSIAVLVAYLLFGHYVFPTRPLAVQEGPTEEALPRENGEEEGSAGLSEDEAPKDDEAPPQSGVPGEADISLAPEEASAARDETAAPSADDEDERL